MKKVCLVTLGLILGIWEVLASILSHIYARTYIWFYEIQNLTFCLQITKVS